MRLIVTRPAAQARSWVDALRALGLDAQALPLIDITALADPSPVHAAWQGLEGFSLIVFVSANAVEQFFAARPPAAAWPEGLVAGATGPGTTAALGAAGVARVEAPATDAPQFDSEALWSRLASWSWTGRRVLVVRGEDGRDWLAEQLRARGAEVSFVAAYRRRCPVLGAPAQGLLVAARADPAQHLWIFSSSEALVHLQSLAPGADWSAAQAVASHPRIAEAARRAGFGRVELVAPDAQALARHLRQA